MSTIALTTNIAPFSRPLAQRPNLEGRFRLTHVSDDALHAGVKTLAGRYNVLTADLLAHLAEVDARGIYRERACSSLYTYCVYELRLSEDEAQRRTKAARTAREFPALFEMLAEGAIHLTGLLLLAPYLTRENHGELLARARFRTKREIEHLVAEIAPRPDVPARIEPLGPRRVANLWQAYAASLRGAVRELAPGVTAGDAPPVVVDESNDTDPAPDYEQGHGDNPGGAARTTESSCDVSDVETGVEADVRTSGRASDRVPAPARVDTMPSVGSQPLAPQRYRVEFTASARYVELLGEARDLLQHRDRDVARVHELAMRALVELLRKRRRAETSRQKRVVDQKSAPARVNDTESDGSAPARVPGTEDAPAPARTKRHVPAGIRRAVWRRDAGRCTFEDSSGRRCDERAGLEIHHEHAFALGGATTLENLRLLCRAHNALLAERDFGREHIERLKSARDGTAAR